MKRITIIFFAVLFVLLCSCGSDKNSKENETVKTVKVEYIADEGGEIVGESVQSAKLSNGSATFSSVTAVANDGYRFIGWSDGNEEATRQDTLTKDETFTAKFEKINYVTVAYKATEGGYIDGESVQVDEDCITTSTVMAQANAGYRFIKWSDGKTERSRTDTFTTNTEIIAIFEKIPYITVEYKSSEGGSIEGELSQTAADSITTSTVKAVANPGYLFKGWDDGVLTEERFDTCTENKVYTAIFEKDPIVRVEYIATEGGYIDGLTVQTGENHLLTSAVKAVAYSGYKFVKWDDGFKYETRSDSTPISITYTAIFQKVHKVSFLCDEKQGTIEGRATQNVLDGTRSFQVTATPKAGYQFVKWSTGETTPSITVAPSSDMEVTAYFEMHQFQLPTISINTENSAPIVSKDEYINCSVTIGNTEAIYTFADEGARIKGRGNTSWDAPKKPYKLKFDDGLDLFGFGKAKTWTLISNYTDLSLIRNYLAYSVASAFSGLQNSCKTQFVDLYLNGEYLGVYMLCEQIEAHENRVDIDEYYDVIDTGYLVELDGRKDGVNVYVGDKHYVIKSPEADDPLFTDEHKTFIKDYLTECLNAVNADDYEKIKELIDVESFAQAYIVFELFNCVDVGFSSFYMYKEAGGKLYCGPVWDFDRSLGVVGNTHGAAAYDTLWAKQENPWFRALLEHEEFYNLVCEQLYAYEDIINDKLTECYDYVYQYEESFLLNFERWKILGTFVWPNSNEICAMDTWQEQVEFTRDYLYKSMNFLKTVYLLY